MDTGPTSTPSESIDAARAVVLESFDMDIDYPDSTSRHFDLQFIAENPIYYGSDNEGSDEDEDEDYDDVEYGEDVPIGIEIEDFLAEEMEDSNTRAASPDDSGETSPKPHVNHSRFVDVNGKPMLKSTLVATLSNKLSKKVTTRVLRARGLASETALRGVAIDDRRLDDSNLESGNPMKSGELSAMLVGTPVIGDSDSDTLELAVEVIEITGFREGSKVHATLAGARLRDSKLRVVGQLLEMVPSEIDEEGDETWEWIGHYMKLDTSLKDQVNSRR